MEFFQTLISQLLEELSNSYAYQNDRMNLLMLVDTFKKLRTPIFKDFVKKRVRAGQEIIGNHGWRYSGGVGPA